MQSMIGTSVGIAMCGLLRLLTGGTETMPRWRVWNNSVSKVVPSFSASHGLPSQLTSARSYQPPIQMSLSWMTRITCPVT